MKSNDYAKSRTYLRLSQESLKPSSDKILWKDNLENETHKEGLRKLQSLSTVPAYKVQNQVQNDQPVIEQPTKSSNLFNVLFTISTSQSKTTKHTKKQKKITHSQKMNKLKYRTSSLTTFYNTMCYLLNSLIFANQMSEK